MKQLATILHTLLCDTPHTYNIEHLFQPSCAKCQYYLEDQMIEAWDCVDHKKWLEKAEEFASSLQLSNLEEVESLVSDTLRLTKPLNDFLRQNPGMTELTLRILNLGFPE